MELSLQIFGTLFLLALIVFMIYGTYTNPHSEYGRLLDEMPDTYTHLSDDALEQEVEKPEKSSINLK